MKPSFVYPPIEAMVAVGFRYTTRTKVACDLHSVFGEIYAGDSADSESSRYRRRKPAPFHQSTISKPNDAARMAIKQVRSHLEERSW